MRYSSVWFSQINKGCCWFHQDNFACRTIASMCIYVHEHVFVIVPVHSLRKGMFSSLWNEISTSIAECKANKIRDTKPSERTSLPNQSKMVGTTVADRLVLSFYKCSHHHGSINVLLSAVIRHQILADPCNRGAYCLKGEF